MGRNVLRRSVMGIICRGAKAFCSRLADTAREEHTIIGTMAPPQSEGSLSPPQMLHM